MFYCMLATYLLFPLDVSVQVVVRYAEQRGRVEPPRPEVAVLGVLADGGDGRRRGRGVD